jgi:type IV secretion system protein VirB9
MIQMKMILIASLLAACFIQTAQAADIPEPGKLDARVRSVTYKKDDVTVVNVRRGAVTRIVLADDEKIVAAATGFTADCSKAELEWCVHADVGTNQIWVKPKDNATHNNLELKSDKRDYSFEFRVLPDAEHGRNRKAAGENGLDAEPMFRVIFRYPVVVPPMPAFLVAPNVASAPLNEKAVLEERIAASKPVGRNWKYSMQVVQGSEEIAPSMVFDDGRFTYFRFPENREVPTIFYISATGEESRINYHMEDDLAVVQRMGREFVLRLGQATVGVWNDAYDPNGVAPKDGTTIDGVTRTLRQGNNK